MQGAPYRSESIMKSPSRRVIEVIPPALVWLAVTAPAWAAVVAPWALGYFLIAFAAYWLWRTIEFAAGLLLGVWRVRVAGRRNWQAPAAGPPPPPGPRPPR